MRQDNLLRDLKLTSEEGRSCDTDGLQRADRELNFFMHEWSVHLECR